ncbi:MAG: hypothetical protein A2Y48_08580 [Nitrospirae bacterium RIFCSPLOW2_12_42_9]|nr:MAG: hypothetical protein A2Y48_08580 [Nitrospirae bacterium RIFCSPLOW2_12_42_9]
MITKSKSLQSIKVITVAVLSFLNLILVSPPAFAHPDEGGDSHIIPHEIGKLNITGGITSIIQGASGVADINDGDVVDYTYTLDLNFEAAVSTTGKVIIALEAGDGDGVNVIGGVQPFFSVPNYDANITESGGIVTPSVSQAYFEGSFFDGMLGLKAGKLDVHSCHDDNAYANDETDQFISGLFSRYAGSIFPELDSYYAPGMILSISPADMLDVTLAVANGVNSGFEDITEDPYGAGQVNVKPNIFGKEGNYRLYVIYDTRDNYIDIGNPDKIRKNTAYGISLDQEIIDDIGIFARYGVQDSNVEFWTDDGNNVVNPDEISYPVKSAISGGVSLSGSFWGRGDDVVGLAYGVLFNNEDSTYFNAVTDSGNETHLEFYYKLGFSDHFTLTPDLQLVTNAGGDADTDPITVYGVRAQMNF